MADYQLLHGDALTVLRTLPTSSVHCIVTSPPYYGLRDYGTGTWIGGDPACDHRPGNARRVGATTLSGGTATAGHQQEGYRQVCGKCGALRQDDQIGLEPTVEEYVARLVAVCEECWRVLRDDGTLWLNLGDSYASNYLGGGPKSCIQKHFPLSDRGSVATLRESGLKPKDLIGIPWRVAFALQAAGWWLRADIIWCLSGGTRVYAKTQKGVMPISIKDLVRLDPSTVQLWNGEKWTQVLGWTRSARTDDAIEIELRSGEKIGCTLGHQWPTQRGLITARDLRVGDVLERTVLPEETWRAPAGLPDSDIGWLVGMYLAAGSMDTKSIRIASHQRETERFERCKSIAEAYGGTATWRETSANGASITIYGPVLLGIIKAYISGDGAKTKRLRNCCWRRSNMFLRNLLEGYLQGDGHWEAGNRRWRIAFTRNCGLADDLRTLCARLDYSIRLRAQYASCEGKSFPSFRGEIRMEHSGHHNEKADTEIIKIGMSRARQFWDIAVEDDPHLFALASGVLTHNSKKAPMPESVTDRPTRSHEHVFLLAKSARYYYDAEAVRETSTFNQVDWQEDGTPKRASHKRGDFGGKGALAGREPFRAITPTRNMRDVWHLGPEPYPGAHFATFPTEVPRRAISAGTSEWGCCPICGAPWQRIIEKGLTAHDGKTESKYEKGSIANRLALLRQAARERGAEYVNSTRTVGWQQTCACPPADPIPCTVLDPFAGSGTTLAVAVSLGRRAIGIELNVSYIELARKRIEAAKLPLLEAAKIHW